MEFKSNRARKQALQRGGFTLKANPIPPSIRATVRLYHYYLFDGASVNTAIDRGFYINSAYDPTASGGGGTQPIGFDQYMAFYTRYRVVNTKLDLRFANTSSAANAIVNIAVKFDDSNANNTTLATYAQGVHKACQLGGVTGMGRDRIQISAPMAMVAGRTTAEYDAEQNYSGTVSSNPTTPLLGHILCTCTDNTFKVTMFSEIIMEVEFYERALLPV